MKQKSDQMEKARIGAIGENNVVSILMQYGWDAFNANCTIKNYKSIDIVCLNNDVPESIDKPWKPSMALVQVKTCTQSNIPVGFTIEEALDKYYLYNNVRGPYVFVSITDNGGTFKFRYFILSRVQFVELLYASNYWYKNDWNRGTKDINVKAPAGLYVRWLEGESDESTKRHKAFKNPLDGVSCENCWENIWKD